ncbi:MAG: hypothetical protein H6559_34895 [Lewinellaceae bacterium]|nr:hypothetical protein [Lewinellaceae bacterium]
MRTTTILAAFALAAALPACSEDPFFEMAPPEAPAAFRLKEQLQSDELDCPGCRPKPPMANPPAPEKEQLQDQDNDEQDGCPACGALPPGPWDWVLPLKEQLQGGEDDDLGCCGP